MIRKEVIRNESENPVFAILNQLQQGVPSSEIIRRQKADAYFKVKEQETNQKNYDDIYQCLSELPNVLKVSRYNLDDTQNQPNSRNFNIVINNPCGNNFNIEIKFEPNESKAQEFLEQYGKSPKEAAHNLIAKRIIFIDDYISYEQLKAEVNKKYNCICHHYQYSTFFNQLEKYVQQAKPTEAKGWDSVRNVGKALFKHPKLVGIKITKPYSYEDAVKKIDLIVFLNLPIKDKSVLVVGVQVKSCQETIKKFRQKSRKKHINPAEFKKHRFILINGQKPEQEILSNFKSQLEEIVDFETSS